MKSLWIEKKFLYDGSQLRSLYAYLTWKIQGDSIIAWEGPCEIPFEHMVDGEDFVAGAEIRGGHMLHFIVEVFDQTLFAGVSVQRLMAAIVKDILTAETGAALRRDGDDLYLDDRKLSISIATKSPVSTMVHFAVNVTNEGTPVKTLALQDLGVPSAPFAKRVMELVSGEVESIRVATQKVRPVL